MSANELKNKESSESPFVLQPYLLKFVGVAAILLIIIPLLPGFLSNLAYSFSGKAPKIYWYLSRSAGFVGITILWVAMALGLGITNKMARLWPGAPTAFAIHEYVSLLGLAFVIYHGLTLMGDHFVDFSLPRLLLPFSIEWKTQWVGLGQVSFYVWVIAALSFYVRRWIGQKTWRLIHYANFATFIMGWLHGIFTGTDSNIYWVRWYYWILGGSLLILLAYRVRDSMLKKNISFSQILRQRIQTLSQESKTLEAVPVVQTEQRVPESLFREQAMLSVSPTRKTVIPPITLITPSQTKSINPGQNLQSEKTRPRASEMPATENKAQVTADPSPAVAAPAEVRTTPAAPVEKYETGTGDNKINVRIFREPPTEPIVEKSQEGAKTNHVDMKLVMRKLKKDFTATPIQPSITNKSFG